MKTYFYWRFSRKIEDEFWIFYKRFPWKFFCSEKFLNGLSSIETGIECWAIPAIDLLPPCLWWSEVKWKVKSESEVNPCLVLQIFSYSDMLKGGVLGNNNIGIQKCTRTFLWVLNFGEVGEILENFQKHPLGESF